MGVSEAQAFYNPVGGETTSYITPTDAKNSIAQIYTDLLSKSGGTMSGALTLSGAPSGTLHAATKKYVDDSDTLLSNRITPLESFGNWISYTPILYQSSQISIININSVWCKVGQLVICRVGLSIQQTGYGSNPIYISHPTAAGPLYYNDLFLTIGSGTFYDASSGTSYPVLIGSSDTVFHMKPAWGTPSGQFAFGADARWNYAVGGNDRIAFTVTYQVT
jgi:hypothetical protein